VQKFIDLIYCQNTKQLLRPMNQLGLSSENGKTQIILRRISLRFRHNVYWETLDTIQYLTLAKFKEFIVILFVQKLHWKYAYVSNTIRSMILGSVSTLNKSGIVIWRSGLNTRLRNGSRVRTTQYKHLCAWTCLFVMVWVIFMYNKYIYKKGYLVYGPLSLCVILCPSSGIWIG
jgi:hypothetical protein